MTHPTRIVDSHQHVFWHGRNDAGLIYHGNAERLVTPTKAVE